jgi:hypothetical protein
MYDKTVRTAEKSGTAKNCGRPKKLANGEELKANMELLWSWKDAGGRNVRPEVLLKSCTMYSVAKEPTSDIDAFLLKSENETVTLTTKKVSNAAKTSTPENMSGFITM